MFIPVNGLMVAAMDVVFIAVKMVVGMQAHSNGALNMVLVITISGNIINHFDHHTFICIWLFLYGNFKFQVLFPFVGIGIHMLESISLTKCTDLECIILQMDIDTKDHGMKEDGKDSECTLSEMVKRNLGTGKMAFLMFQAQRI